MATPPSTADANTTIVRRFVDELWNAADLSVADEIFAADCRPHTLHHSPLDFGGRYGPKHIKLIVAAWRAAFPDWHIAVTDLVAGDDKVMLVTRGTGTHLGELMGIGPTGRHVTFTGMRIFRIADGKIAEYWVLWDWVGLWQQLGAIPTRAMPAPGSRYLPVAQKVLRTVGAALTRRVLPAAARVQ